MTDHPILFSAPMVRAILDGSKTQTRRVLKPQPIGHTAWQDDDTGRWWVSGHGEGGDTLLSLRYAPGDRLWVREAWNVFALSSDGDESWPVPSIPAVDPRNDPEMRRAYCLDYPVASLAGTDGGKGPWRSSIHMPRWASRITLAVEAVRVERLHDISEGDAIAEGVTRVRDCCYVIRGFDYDLSGLCHTSAITPFGKYWTHVHGAEAWDANPWVSVTTFRRVEA